MGKGKQTRRDFLKATSAAVAGASLVPIGASLAADAKVDTSKILSYNENMEYRRCGKTGWMVSAVCLGGHWKRVNKMVPSVFKGESWLSADLKNQDFIKNRTDVVTRCLDRGINYIDACTHSEIIAYSKAVEGRRDKVYLGWSWYENEARKPTFRTAEALLKTLDAGMKECKQEYVDLWRITCISNSSKGPDGKMVPPHTEAESAEIAKALAQAKKAGKARMTGISSHDQPWLEYMMKTFPNEISVVVCPYTAKTKALPEGSFFDTIKQCDCGFFGIKPFSSAAMFKGDSSPGSPHREEDDRIARLTIRYVLCNPVLTAPIPGMINVEQVDNVALAVMERRELDAKEKADLDKAATRAWAALPRDYQWLKKWEYV
ncbi:MAG: aldo/keto reductase [Planctomycetota bacterium]